MTQFEAAKAGDLQWFKNNDTFPDKIDLQLSTNTLSSVFSILTELNNYEIIEWLLQKSVSFHFQRDFMNLAQEALGNTQLGLFKVIIEYGYLQAETFQRESVDLTKLIGLIAVLEYPDVNEWLIRQLRNLSDSELLSIDLKLLDDYAVCYDNPRFYDAIQQISSDKLQFADDLVVRERMFMLVEANKPILLRHASQHLPADDSTTQLYMDLYAAAINRADDGLISELKDMLQQHLTKIHHQKTKTLR